MTVFSFRPPVLVTFLLGAAAGLVSAFFLDSPGRALARALASETKPPAPAQSPAALGMEGLLPDQSHAMADVAYHFGNLWFAAKAKNWGLAGFYIDETRSHLKWAVRLKPIRKDSAGQDINLQAILEAVDNSFLSEIKRAIEAKDAEKVSTLYRQTLEGCYGCHKASGKPYLRPRIPENPGASVIQFDPAVDWPR